MPTVPYDPLAKVAPPAPQTRQFEYTQDRGNTPDAFGAQIGEAMQGFGKAISSIAGKFESQSSKTADFQLETQWNDWKAADTAAGQKQEFTAPPEGIGYTAARTSGMDTGFKTFLSTVPKYKQAEYTYKYSSYRGQQTLHALDFEQKQQVSYAGLQIKDFTAKQAVGLDQNSSAEIQAARIADVDALIDKSPLPPALKEEQKLASRITLATAAANKEARDLAEQQLTALHGRAGVNDNTRAGVMPAESVFESRLINRENASRNPATMNKWGYVGNYQFGAPLLSDLGVYKPNATTRGWGDAHNVGGEEKWGGTFNIPGYPEVKSIQDFRASPEAQKKVFQLHVQNMDKTIAANGWEKHIGRNIGGTPLTKEGLYGMIHLGGPGGTRDLLDRGIDNKDANGTPVSSYAKLGVQERGVPALPGGKAPEAKIDQATVDYFKSRGAKNAEGANPEFASRLQRALDDAEKATGVKARVGEMQRPPEVQAQYRANYTRQPVTYGGKTYQPQGPGGGLAAPPGKSRHEPGNAADIPEGPVLDYLHKNAGKYGLEFLKGKAFEVDSGHIQMAGGAAPVAAGPVDTRTPAEQLLDEPRFRDVPLEQRRAIINHADREAQQNYNNQIAARIKDEKAYVGQVKLGVHDGAYGHENLMADRTPDENGVARLNDPEDIIAIDNAIMARDKKINEDGAAFVKYASPDPWSDLNPDDNKAFNSITEKLNGVSRIGQMDEKFVDDALLPMVKHTGMLGSDSEAALVGMTRQPDYKKMRWAYGTLDQLQRAGGPTILKDSVAKDLAVFNTLSQWHTPEEVVERMREVPDPGIVSARKLRKEELDKQNGPISTYVSVPNFLEKMDPSWGPFTQPLAPEGEQAGVLQADLNAIFSDQYIRNGGKGQEAWDATVQIAQKRWGATGVGDVSMIGSGQRLMKNAPENFTGPPISGSYAHLNAQGHQQMEAQGMPKGQQFWIMADATTEADISARRPPTYVGAYWKTGDPMPTSVPGRLSFSRERAVLDIRIPDKSWTDVMKTEIINAPDRGEWVPPAIETGREPGAQGEMPGGRIAPLDLGTLDRGISAQPQQPPPEPESYQYSPPGAGSYDEGVGRAPPGSEAPTEPPQLFRGPPPEPERGEWPGGRPPPDMEEPRLSRPGPPRRAEKPAPIRSRNKPGPGWRVMPNKPGYWEYEGPE